MGERGGGGAHARGSHPKEVVGGAQDLYCDRDHVVPDTWCTTCPDTWCTTCPAPRDGGRVCSASRSGDPCCIGDIQCLAWSGDLSAGSTPADVWGGLGWVVRLGLLLSLSLFCCAASDGLFTTTHFSPRMPCMSLHRGGGGGGAVRGQRSCRWCRQGAREQQCKGRRSCSACSHARTVGDRGGRSCSACSAHIAYRWRRFSGKVDCDGARGGGRGRCTSSTPVRRRQSIRGVRSCNGMPEQERP